MNRGQQGASGNTPEYPGRPLRCARLYVTGPGATIHHLNIFSRLKGFSAMGDLAKKPWSRETIRALKAVEDEQWHRVDMSILYRLQADRLIDKIEYYEISERGEEVLNGQ